MCGRMEDDEYGGRFHFDVSLDVRFDKPDDCAVQFGSSARHDRPADPGRHVGWLGGGDGGVGGTIHAIPFCLSSRLRLPGRASGDSGHFDPSPPSLPPSSLHRD